jgi:hypothetical protein
VVGIYRRETEISRGIYLFVGKRNWLWEVPGASVMSLQTLHKSRTSRTLWKLVLSLIRSTTVRLFFFF